MNPSRVMRSAAVVGASTALSRLLGFVREMLMAYYFGTTLAKSAFDVAFRIPNLFRTLFGEGALASAFVPVFTRTLVDEGHDKADRLAGRILTMLLAVLGLIVLAGILGITAALSTAELGARSAAVLPLLRIMIPYILFICVAAFCMALQNALHRFALPAMTPVVLNIVWIATIVLVSPLLGVGMEARIRGVAWGILAAGALQMGIQFPALRALGFRLPPVFGWNDPRLRRVLALMGPAALGMGIHQVNVCVDGILALWAARWAPAALTFAERLVYLPLGVFATAFGTVLLPAFSRQAAARSYQAMGRTLTHSMRVILVLMLPAAAGLAALAGPIVTLVYRWGGGAFDAESARLTALALTAYAPGLLVFSLYKLLVPVFYAHEDARTPVVIGIKVVVLNFLLNLVAILWLPEGYRHVGMATATVLGSAVNCVELGLILRRRAWAPAWRRLAGTLGRAGVAVVLMTAAVLAVYHGVAGAAWAGIPVKLHQLANVGLAIAAGVGVYVALLALFCRDELRLVREP